MSTEYIHNLLNLFEVESIIPIGLDYLPRMIISTTQECIPVGCVPAAH